MGHRSLEGVDLLLQCRHLLSLRRQLVASVIECLSDVRLNTRIGAAARDEDGRTVREKLSSHGQALVASETAGRREFGDGVRRSTPHHP